MFAFIASTLGLSKIAPDAQARMNLMIPGGQQAEEEGGTSYEDFTTYTCHEDGGGTACNSDDNDQGELSINSSTSVQAIGMTRNEYSYIYYDKGAGYFSGDWTVQFEITLANGADGGLSYFVFGNDVGDKSQQVDAAAIYAYYGTPTLTILIIENGSDITEDTSANLSGGTKYYVTWTRDDDGGANNTGQHTVVICTGDYGCETPTDTITADCSSGEQNDYRYIFPIMSLHTGGDYRVLDVTVENLSIE